MKWNQQMRAQEAACFAGPHIELADHFFRYKLLKAHIKRVVNDPQLDTGEASFKTHLVNEMDRVSQFYTSKEEDYLQVLEKKLIPRAEKVVGPCTDAELPSNSPEDLDVSSIAERFKDSDCARLFRDFASLSESVKALKRFALVNALAVIKATKKHDKNMKQFDKSPLQKEMAERLAQQSIVKLPKLSPLQHRLDRIVLQLVAKHKGCSGGGNAGESASTAPSQGEPQVEPVLTDDSPSPQPTVSVAPLLFENLVRAAGHHPPTDAPADKAAAPPAAHKDEVAAQSPSTKSGGVQVQPRLRRRKQGEGGKQALGGKPVDPDEDVDQDPIVVNAAVLREYFNLPLADAAHKLGICATAIKKVCRKMGISKWPYKTIKPIERRLQYLREKLATREGGEAGALLEEMRALEAKREEQLRTMCNIGSKDDAKEGPEEDDDEDEEPAAAEQPGGEGRSTLHVWGMRVNVAT